MIYSDLKLVQQQATGRATTTLALGVVAYLVMAALDLAGLSTRGVEMLMVWFSLVASALVLIWFMPATEARDRAESAARRGAPILIAPMVEPSVPSNAVNEDEDASRLASAVSVTLSSLRALARGGRLSGQPRLTSIR